MPPVLNQGGLGTCVSYAFAQALQTGLMGKYGVPCNAADLVARVQTLCPCWDGHDADRMVNEWNKVHKKEKAAIIDVDNKTRYNVQVTSRQVFDFEEAYRETERAENLKMYLLCTIKTNEQGHVLHALALAGVFVSEGGDKKMQALDSKGSNKTYMDVSPLNFVSATTFDPHIVRVYEGKTSLLPNPKPLDAYLARLRRVQQVNADARF